MTEDQLIRKAMAALGRRKSPAKTAAARRNAKLPRGPRKKKDRARDGITKG